MPRNDERGVILNEVKNLGGEEILRRFTPQNDTGKQADASRNDRRLA